MHHVAITTFGWALPTGTGWTNTVTGTQTIKLPLECVFVKARIQQSESRSMLRCVDSDGRKDGQWEMSVSTAEKSMPIFLLQQHRPKVTSVHFSPFLICSIQPFILFTHTHTHTHSASKTTEPCDDAQALQSMCVCVCECECVCVCVCVRERERNIKTEQ